MAKTALCIGINDYPGTGSDLQGCVHDAQDWSAALSKRGYTVQLMTDGQATKLAMTEAMRAVIQTAKSGDNVVITYSGHGTIAPDIDGDEADGFDEALCPHDIRTAGALLDDEIHRLFAERTPGVRLVLVSDSCHSGTVTRSAGIDPLAEGSRIRFLPPGAWLRASELPRAANGELPTRVAVATKASPWTGALVQGASDDLLMAGCEEGPNHYSYDAVIAGRPNGAYSYYALKTLATLPAEATYAQWHAEIRKCLPSQSYPQIPQIFGAKSARKRKPFA